MSGLLDTGYIIYNSTTFIIFNVRYNIALSTDKLIELMMSDLIKLTTVQP